MTSLLDGIGNSLYRIRPVLVSLPDSAGLFPYRTLPVFLTTGIGPGVRTAALHHHLGLFGEGSYKRDTRVDYISSSFPSLSRLASLARSQ